jgi:tRNA(Ile)-lysidine synthase
MSVLGDLPTVAESKAKVFRPMLGVRRAETAAYCDELGLTPIQDHTNLDTGIPRNFLRLEAIPLLETLNPKVIEGLGRLTEAVSIDLDYIESRLDVVWADLAEETAGVFVMKRDLFHALHPSLQRHALRSMYGEALGSTAGLEGVHVESMLALVKGPAGKELTLPGGVRMETRFDAIILFPPGGDDRTLPALQGQQLLNVPGDTVVGGWKVCAEIVSRPEALDVGDYTSYFDADSLAGTVSVRGWEDGDRFQPLGMADGGKKLQDFYVDAHVPQSWRERVPLVVTPKGVAWVVGYRIAHWARVAPETQQVMKVEFERVEG